MQHYQQMPVVLRVWENDFGLPSVDPQCLELMLICKLAFVDVKFQRANLPFYRAIPSIEHNTVIVTNPHDMIVHLESLWDGTPKGSLSKEDMGRIFAFKKYFTHKFVPAFLYDCWINPINYEHTIKTWYVNSMLFPLGYLYTHYKYRQTCAHFRSIIGGHSMEKNILKLYNDAECCLQDIATVLSNDSRCYFLGKDPTTLDALIYSYLAVTLYLPLPEPYLQNLVKEYPVLVEYVERITKRYFPNIQRTFKYVEPLDTTFEAASTKTLVIVGIFVTTLMTAYAWNIGIISNVWFPTMNAVNKLCRNILILINRCRFSQIGLL